MSSIPRQLATFAGVLVVLYAVGFGVGQLIDDDGSAGHGPGSGNEPAHQVR